ncbi:hypothetical protein B0H17DRAFT_707300 [Mycena rosella]|uniref:Chromo domain-containing protein n=1 Tax=Mycena rosella TaxID=1033263 RepID=A0AAD7DA35_MYCRO|nr:hypothetical protein B0H17DRAFT_707300 [Mycena rosella]
MRAVVSLYVLEHRPGRSQTHPHLPLSSLRCRTSVPFVLRRFRGSDVLCLLFSDTDTLPSLPDTECSRPGCPVQEKFFEPEGVYGRRTKLDSTLGRVTEWLVFWKGYTWGEVTWESKPPSEVIETFKNRASAAGFNLDDDACIILREAREGGVKNPDH